MSKAAIGARGMHGGFPLARGFVMQWAPYFADTLYAFIPTPYEGLTEVAGGPLAVTERLVLLYEPEWVESIEVEVLATGLCHEVLHNQLMHIPRAGFYPDKAQFNLAGDLFINGLMEKQKRERKNDKGVRETVPLWSLPEWVALPSKYGFPDGLTADEYYNLLEDQKKKNGGGGSGSGTAKLQKKFMCGACGGVAGNPSKLELEKKFNESRGRSEAECRVIARATSQAIKSKMLQEGRGYSPGSWSEFFDIAEDNYVVPWNQLLSSILLHSFNNARSGGLDYSMRRPSSRSYMRGWPLPGLISYEPEIGIVLDTSGSMGRTQIGAAFRIICDVMEQMGFQYIWFMEADAGVQREPIRVAVSDLTSIELTGRGGTNFTPAIEYMQKFEPRISVLIYCTDGDGSAPVEAPTEFETIWCVVPARWQRKPAEWGHTIMLSDHLAGVPKAGSEFDDDE